jgi:hypothetical protein
VPQLARAIPEPALLKRREKAMPEFSLELLTNDALKLMQKELDELYATLGLQLLARNLPTGASGIMSYLSAVREAAEQKTASEALSSVPSLTEWVRGLGIIYEELIRQGARFLLESREELQKSLRTEINLHLPPQNDSAIQILILLVEKALKLPRGFEPIAVTVAVILNKTGLRNFLDQKNLNMEETPSNIIDLEEVVFEPSLLWR